MIRRVTAAGLFPPPTYSHASVVEAGSKLGTARCGKLVEGAAGPKRRLQQRAAGGEPGEHVPLPSDRWPSIGLDHQLEHVIGRFGICRRPDEELGCRRNRLL